MADSPYLALTPWEMGKPGQNPAKIALLGATFSPYGPGLHGLPDRLPEGCPLVVSDHVRIQGHDHARVRDQLAALEPWAVILDFQHPGEPEAAALAACLSQALPCPAVVSAPYARELATPVLLPPCPCHVPLGRHLEGWQGRELWLELSREGEALTLTEAGLTQEPLDGDWEYLHRDRDLCCHYAIELTEKTAVFRLGRTAEDLKQLHRQARALGANTIGLWQEIGDVWQL